MLIAISNAERHLTGFFYILLLSYMRIMSSLSNFENSTKFDLLHRQFILNAYLRNSAFGEYAIWSGNSGNIKLYAERTLMILEKVK